MHRVRNNRVARVSSSRLSARFVAQSGVITLSSSPPAAAASAIAWSLAATWKHAIWTASATEGLTLPGMIDDPGSTSGRRSSPRPAAGPEARSRRSKQILPRSTARARSAPEHARIGRKLHVAVTALGAGRRRRPVIRESSRTTRTRKRGCAVSPVPTAVPPRPTAASSASVARSAAPAPATGRLVGRVRDDLVHIHVGGCAGASLERVEHGDVRDRSVGGASGRPDDGARPPAGEKAEPRVRPRRRRLDVRVGADQRRVGRAPGELERLARALGGGAVERPRRDVLDAEAVARSADPRYAPNLVSRRALAMTSGIRWCDGRTPRLPAAHARSVKAVTGSAPQ